MNHGNIFALHILEDLQYKACARFTHSAPEEVEQKAFKAPLHTLPLLRPELLEKQRIFSLFLFNHPIALMASPLPHSPYYTDCCPGRQTHGICVKFDSWPYKAECFLVHSALTMRRRKKEQGLLVDSRNENYRRVAQNFKQDNVESTGFVQRQRHPRSNNVRTKARRQSRAQYNKYEQKRKRKKKL